MRFTIKLLLNYCPNDTAAKLLVCHKLHKCTDQPLVSVEDSKRIYMYFSVVSECN
jgi:hypothetical protein